MSTFEINMGDYLSEERKAEIAEEMFRDALSYKLSEAGGVDRVLSNISYYAVFDVIDKEVEAGGEKLRGLIRDRAFEHLNKGGNYGIFRSKDRWSDASTATKIVEGLVHEKRDLIEERVHQAITQMPFDMIKEEIKYVLHDRINDILAGVGEA